MAQIFHHFTANALKTAPFPFPSETVMEAYLIDNPAVLALDEEDYADTEILDNQLSLPGAGVAAGANGRIDVLAEYSSGTLAIVEIKKVSLTAAHLFQLQTYLNQRLALIPSTASSGPGTGTEEEPDVAQSIAAAQDWIGVLVGTGIDPTLAQTLSNGHVYNAPGGIAIPIAALVIHRYRGEDGSVYLTTDVHFKPPATSRNYQKYQLNGGMPLNKRRLVLAVVKEHVRRHPNLTIAQLKLAFPDSIHPSFGVFDTVANANAKDPNRYFLKPGEIIGLVDGDIAVCNQWGTHPDPRKDVMGRFLTQARSLGFTITP